MRIKEQETRLILQEHDDDILIVQAISYNGRIVRFLVGIYGDVARTQINYLCSVKANRKYVFTIYI